MQTRSSRREDLQMGIKRGELTAQVSEIGGRIIKYSYMAVMVFVAVTSIHFFNEKVPDMVLTYSRYFTYSKKPHHCFVAGSHRGPGCDASTEP